MKRMLLIIIAALIIALFVPTYAYADVMEDLDKEVSDNLGNIDFTEVDEAAGGFFQSVSDKVK